MSHLRYDARPPTADTDGPLRERALARALARWVLSHGGSARLADLAGRAAVAELAGDTALAALADDARETLQAEALVGNGDVQTPFVLDAAGRFYLWRNFQQEGDVAAMIHARRAAGLPVEIDDVTVDALFPGGDPALDGAQRQAVRAVGGRKIFVLTGGPGTGKTTTVLRMLLRLQRDGAAGQGIAVAAPTGKAAQRLVQSLRSESARLRRHLPPSWHAGLDALPVADALTVHRLLGYSPTRNAYTRGPDTPIDAGIVVVDEASMLDLAQLHALLRALRPEAVLVLVGDADQLNPVGAGSVLLDLVSALETQAAPELVRLRHSFRADTRLVPVNEAVRAGDATALDAALVAAGDRATVRAVETPAALARETRRWADGLAEAGPPGVSAGDEAVALQALAASQLLCALREGPFGADAMNASIERHLRLRWNVPAGETWYPGRVVMVTHNDYGARLFNGDIGLCLRGADGTLHVWFEAADGGGVRAFAPGALPAHAPAWALTIHKSQGSEYGHAAVLLPPDPEHRILSRQLLYTALSRARRQVEIWAPRASVDSALGRAVRRSSGLADRLAKPG